ncbi:serine/threonine protein kinase [Vibrio variabilis]|uniref:serine/threonine protein kinase n=1 Tax=Vibrio variabilis TaxID=990271 RepID=UPI0013A70B77|nr:serine/threonine-protein kinase [Vibrio variabilis]
MKHGHRTELLLNFHYMDEAEQATYLDKLKFSDPKLHQELLSEQSSVHSDLTQILGRHASVHVDGSAIAQTELGPYRISERIGRGGMSQVYLAERCDGRFEQSVAIKVFEPHLTNMVGKAMLYWEAQLLAKLNHPNIANVLDANETDSSVFLVIEHVKGQSLTHWLTTNPSYSVKLALFYDITDAIHHAHAQGVFHGDLKPENILVDENGDAKVIDFSIATHDARYTDLHIYSADYASPTQKQTGKVDASSDIYALGKIFNKLFPSHQHNSEAQWVYHKCTQPSTFQYFRIAELKSDIKALQHNKPIDHPDANALYRCRKLLKRRPLASALTVLLLTSGLGFVSALINKNLELQQQQRVSNELLLEMTQLLFHGHRSDAVSLKTMLDLTSMRLLNHQDLPIDIKQKLVLAMLMPDQNSAEQEQKDIGTTSE